MHLNGQIGETAGEVWRLLDREGAQTMAQIKKKLPTNGEVVNFALGWLAREDKVELVPDKKSFRIQLK